MTADSELLLNRHRYLYLPAAHVGKGTEDSPFSGCMRATSVNSTTTRWHVLKMQLTRKRVELVPWSIAATRGPSMILFDDAAIVLFIELVSVNYHRSQKYNTGHSPYWSALRPLSRSDFSAALTPWWWRNTRPYGRRVFLRNISLSIYHTLKSKLWSLNFIIVKCNKMTNCTDAINCVIYVLSYK